MPSGDHIGELLKNMSESAMMEVDDWLENQCEDGDTIKVLKGKSGHVWLQNNRTGQVYMTGINMEECDDNHP